MVFVPRFAFLHTSPLSGCLALTLPAALPAAAALHGGATVQPPNRLHPTSSTSRDDHLTLLDGYIHRAPSYTERSDRHTRAAALVPSLSLRLHPRLAVIFIPSLLLSLPLLPRPLPSPHPPPTPSPRHGVQLPDR